VKDLQLQVQTLVEENRSLTEEVKHLQANKLKRGSNINANPEFDELIVVFGKKYSVMFEMFPPSPKLFQQPPPSMSVKIISQSRYETAASADMTLLAEFHSALHPTLATAVALIQSNHFAKKVRISKMWNVTLII